ncbi:MAG: prepilin-type N-terminal cleavage/methylation domain-containing protein [Planctomycetota bacterium]|jgi:prepilin-type N-terminal cleavage/methylation domain-containing protein
MNARTAETCLHRRGLRPANGFTLVELLVVVSIIALLISILLPSLKCARAQTKRAVCIANLKGIATASIVYASDDANEAAVPVHPILGDPSIQWDLRLTIGRVAWGGKSGRGKEGSDVYFWGTGRKKGPATRPLNKFIYKDGFVDYALNPGAGFSNWKKDHRLDLDMYRCPADNGYGGINKDAWKNSGLSGYDHYGNSFVAGLIYIYTPGGETCPGEMPGTCCYSNSAALRPLSRIPNPSNTIYYEENVGRYAFRADPQGINGNCGTSDFPEDVIRGWHGCTQKTKDWLFNAAFADAHAGTIRKKGFENPHLSELPGCDANTAQCYNYWHCVIIRGPGYQKDTLPSPPVATTIPCSS